MTAIKYLDFNLLIEKNEQGYCARVLDSPHGQASADFSAPFSAMELENFMLRIGRPRRGLRRLESPEMMLVKDFGRKLFQTVFQGDVLTCLHGSIAEADRNNTGLRIRLRLSDTPELVSIPWEFLYDGAANRFFSLSVDTPIVRYLDLAGRVEPLTVHPPLRILVMIASPQDYPELDVEQEWHKLKEATAALEARGLLILDRLAKASLDTLRRQLRSTKYHIFHYIGHGGFDQQAEDGVLVLEGEHRQSHLVSGQRLGTVLHDADTLRLALLNACEGGRTSQADTFAGVAQSLLQQGVPAVIAMQFAITDKAAIVLTHEFYAALADSLPVDAALSEARKAIFTSDNDIEWGTPVLYMRSPDGHIFDVAAPPLPPSAPLVEPNPRLPTSTPTRGSVVAPPASRNPSRPLWQWMAGVVVIIAVALGFLRYLNSPSLINPTTLEPRGEVITITPVPATSTVASAPPTPTPAPTDTAPPPPPAAAILDFGGTWQTNLATLTVAQTGAEVVITVQGYGDNWNYFVEGVVDGQQILLKESEVLNEFAITVSEDQRSFVSTDPNLAFCGVRSGPLPHGCGFSGKWHVRASDASVPEGSYAVLVQTGRQVKGSLFDATGHVIDHVSGEVAWGKGWWLDGQGNQSIPAFTWGMDSNERSFEGYSPADGPRWDGWRDSPVTRDKPRLVQGRVVDSAGDPIAGISIAVTQADQRVDAQSGQDGTFYASLPSDSTGLWAIGVVGISCTSRIMDADCNISEHIAAKSDATVALPQTEEIVLVYESATAKITGVVVDQEGQPVGGMRVRAQRSDGAYSYIDATASGEFSLPASPGEWKVFAVLFNPWRTGEAVAVTIESGDAPEPITVTAP